MVPASSPNTELLKTQTLPRTLPAKSIKRLYLVHLAVLHILPAVGTFVAVALLPWYAPSWYHLFFLFLGWFLTAAGISVGYHRLFTHRSFRASSGVRWALAIFGSLAAQGPISYWVAVHRRHHEQSDTEGDPHSPINGMGRSSTLRSLWHAHFGWTSSDEIPNPLVYAPDIAKDAAAAICSRYYFLVSLIGNLILPAIVLLITWSWRESALMLLWAGAVRIFATSHLIFSINSICHAFGFQSYETGDNSRNNLLLAIPTFGEGWHNNHHCFPSSARLGLKWWQVDLGYMCIVILKRVGLASDVKVPAAFAKKEPVL